MNKRMEEIEAELYKEFWEENNKKNGHKGVDIIFIFKKIVELQYQIERLNRSTDFPILDGPNENEMD